ncbi:MAG TPA: F0F1 ATP synthase subunit B, partial [Candidatus Binatia bacterium]|nr:F0F1 ATP synthase subunit B [Candidatus Binatia bacterium]
MDALGIQWRILLAQTISFSFVFFVLWKLAYKPIFNMLELRRQKIADSLANAEKVKADVARTEVERQKILADAGDKANKLIDEARQAAARVREVETQKAIASAEQIVTKAREAAAQERTQMLGELKREVGRL